MRELAGDDLADGSVPELDLDEDALGGAVRADGEPQDGVDRGPLHDRVHVSLVEEGARDDDGGLVGLDGGRGLGHGINPICLLLVRLSRPLVSVFSTALTSVSMTRNWNNYIPFTNICQYVRHFYY